MNSNSYYELISFNYKQDNAHFELKKLIEKEINIGQIETWKLTKDLLNAKNRTNDYPKSIRNFYWLYCEGYDFLDGLAFNYGLQTDCSHISYNASTTEELPEDEKEALIINCYPNIIDEIQKVLNWLKKEEIILTGKTNEHRKLEYIDNRIDFEKIF